MKPEWFVPTSIDAVGVYWWGGYRLASNLALPRLVPAKGKPDLRFMWRLEESAPAPMGRVIEDVLPGPGGTTRAVTVAAAEGYQWIRIEGVGTYVMDTSQHVVDYFPGERANPMLVEHQLVNAMLAHYAATAGELCLHASAVARDGRAIVFAGPSGSGKSTSAWNLLQEGWRVLADDAAVIKRVNGEWVVHQGARTLRVGHVPPEQGWVFGEKTEVLGPTGAEGNNLERLVLLSHPLERGTREIPPAMRYRWLCESAHGWKAVTPSARKVLSAKILRLAEEARIDIAPRPMPAVS